MKPAPFAYEVPTTLGDAIEMLNCGAEEPRLIAGGQSLVPLLNMRLSRPSLLIDLNRVAGLGGLEWQNGHLRIGAMTRQRTLETDPVVRERIPLLAEAAGLIAHVAIRTRGTVGGSLAHADPAAELPAATCALGATFHVRSSNDSRAVPAADFFRGPFTTAIGAGEVLEAVEVPVPPAGSGAAFCELSRVHGAFALAGAAALVGLGRDGTLERVSLALCAVGGEPYLPSWPEQVALGRAASTELWTEIAERVGGEIEPFGDGQASEDVRRQLAVVLTRRALERAFARARGAAST